MQRAETDDQKTTVAQRRLKGFGLHLLGYLVAMVILVPVNLFIYSETFWFVLPMVGWGSILAIHVAYVLGFFGASR